jgi:hypothetical protein
MPNINLYEVYQRKLRKFGTLNDSDTWRYAFTDAVNLVYSEYNEKVFEAGLLEPIGSFDDIIDARLAYFTSITFDDSDVAIGDREYWSTEHSFERLSKSNSFTDTILNSDASSVVISILNDVISVTGDTVTGSVALPTGVDVFTVIFESDSLGNRLIFNGDELGMTYTLGDADTTQAIGEVDATGSHKITGTSGLELTRTRFLSSGTLIYDFLINEGGVSANIADQVAAYTATIVGPVWENRYIEPSTSLDFRYRSSFEMGLDFHLQDGGQWAMEAEPERERKWYGRGIKSARSTYQQLTPYVSPLNP